MYRKNGDYIIYINSEKTIIILLEDMSLYKDKRWVSIFLTPILEKCNSKYVYIAGFGSTPLTINDDKVWEELCWKKKIT